jgi:DNA-binding GntR family transcriptional regulator
VAAQAGFHNEQAARGESIILSTIDERRRMELTTSELKVTPIERSRVSDRAYESIRELIVSGKVKMGTRLTETQLSESLGISRAPIREALQRLAAEGLVDASAHQGVRVTELDADALAELYNVRVGLESVAVRQFIRRGASTHRLQQAVERMESAALKGQYASIVRAELDFHRLIAEGSENALLLRLYRELEGRVLVALALDDAQFAELDEIAREHRPVLEAIEAGDELAAARTMEDHIVSTVGPLLERLGGDRSELLGPGRQ